MVYWELQEEAPRNPDNALKILQKRSILSNKILQNQSYASVNFILSLESTNTGVNISI